MRTEAWERDDRSPAGIHILRMTWQTGDVMVQYVCRTVAGSTTTHDKCSDEPGICGRKGRPGGCSAAIQANSTAPNRTSDGCRVDGVAIGRRDGSQLRLVGNPTVATRSPIRDAGVQQWCYWSSMCEKAYEELQRHGHERRRPKAIQIHADRFPSPAPLMCSARPSCSQAIVDVRFCVFP